MSDPESQRTVDRPARELFGQRRGYGFAGRGVHTATGNYTERATDLAFPSALLGLLDWTRTYNSLSADAGPFGRGWVSAFSAHLDEVANGQRVELFDETGRVLTFVRERPGEYRRAQDLDAVLSRGDGGTWVLRFTTGVRWLFDTTGRLTAREFEGQRVTVTQSPEGRPTLVQHSLGRSLTMTYEDGRLVGVRADDGRTIRYTYAAQGGLASVTGPEDGTTTRYAYAGDRLTEVTDPDGVVLVGNSYDSSGRVVRQQHPTGGSTEFAYDTATIVTTVTSQPTEARSRYRADSNGRLVEMTDPANHTATFEYDANGRLTASVTPRGVRYAQRFDGDGNLLEENTDGIATTYAYDDQDRVTRATDATGRTTRYEYDGGNHIPTRIIAPNGATTTRALRNGLVTSSTDPDGNTTRYDHDARGNLTTITSAQGDVIRHQYDADGNVTELQQAGGGRLRWAYDRNGRVTTHTDAAGEDTRFEWSPAGRLRRATDPDQAETTYTYNEAGLRASVTDPMGSTTSYTYDADGNQTTIRDPEDGTTTFAYNGMGQLTEVVDAAGMATRYGYDADGNNTTAADPTGTTTTTYDVFGRHTAVTTPSGATTQYAYDRAGRTTSVTDAEGGEWRVEHDNAGMPVTVFDPTGALARQRWTQGGYLQEVADPAGRSIGMKRNKRGQVEEITDRQGGVTRIAYDADGRRIAVTTAAGLTSRTEYDNAGRVVARTDPRGWVTRFRYDKRGQKIAETSPSGITKRFRYDQAGRLTAMTNGEGNQAQYGYDRAGRLISVTDPKGAVTRYEYDRAGRVVAVTDPIGRVTRREYDEAGNLAKVVEPDETARHFEYDDEHRLTRMRGHDGTEVSFGYDKAGRRTRVTDASGTTRYSFDKAGRLVRVTDPDGGDLQVRYDEAGNCTGFTYPGGLEVDYRYNLNGKLIGMRDSRAGTADFALDPDSRLLTEQLPGRLARKYHWDLGLLRRFEVYHNGRPVARTDLTRDPENRIISQRDTGPEDGHLRSYRYDRLGQLVASRHWEKRDWPWQREDRPQRYPDDFPFAQEGWAHPAAEEDGHWQEQHADRLDFTYDAAGNRVRYRQGDEHTHYRYDDADQLLASHAKGQDTDYEYDPAGRLTRIRTGDRNRHIEYDGLGRPRLVRTDGFWPSQRIEATHNGDGLVTRLVVSNTDHAHEEERAASVRYRWSAEKVPQVLEQRTDPDLTDTERGFPSALNADFSYGYGRTFVSRPPHWGLPLHRDVYGSSLRTRDTSAWSLAEQYGPFGETGERHGAHGHPGGADHCAHRDDSGVCECREHPRDGERCHRCGHHHVPLPVLPRFGYRGELSLPDVVNLRARDYIPSLGRFTTPDPATSTGMEEVRHPYGYVGNDPLNQTDPRGLFPQVTAAAQAGAGLTAAIAGPLPSGQRQNVALAAIANSIGMLSLQQNPGGDRTTPHNQARDTAAVALGAEMVVLHGPTAIARMYPRPGGQEFEIPRGHKDYLYPGILVPPANAGVGKLDIFFRENAQKGVIWEVKSALSSNPGRQYAKGKAEVAHYIQRYKQAFPGQTAVAGIPMPTALPVAANPALEVYSPNGNFDGVVQYRRATTRPGPPPEPIPVPVPEPRREPRWWEFWEWDWEWPWDWDIDWGKILGGILLVLGIGALIAALIVFGPVLAVAAAIIGLLSLVPLPEYPDPNDPANMA